MASSKTAPPANSGNAPFKRLLAHCLPAPGPILGAGFTFTRLGLGAMNIKTGTEGRVTPQKHDSTLTSAQYQLRTNGGGSSLTRFNSRDSCYLNLLHSGEKLIAAHFVKSDPLTFDFCLRTSIPVLTTSTYVVAWPQGDQFLGGDF